MAGPRAACLPDALARCKGAKNGSQRISESASLVHPKEIGYYRNWKMPEPGGVAHGIEIDTSPQER